jgi:hypothetical protein
MTNFKLGTAAAAILAASAFPALAQETQATETTTGIAIPAGTVIPDEHILLQFTDMADEGFFVVSFEDAAEICGITEPQFAEIAENPLTGVIYCEELQQVEVRNAFIEEGRIVRLTDFEDADDDDDDGDFGDDAQETAVDEAADQADGENDDRNELFDNDDVEAPEDNDDGLDGVDDNGTD